MAARKPSDQTVELETQGPWDNIDTGEDIGDSLPQSRNENSISSEETNQLNHVGYEWFAAKDLSNYISNYVDERDEFRQVYHLDGEDLLEEARDAAETIDELLNETMSNVNSFKEKAEYQAVKTIRKYDQIKQTLSKMEARKEDDQRVVRDEPYQEILGMEEDIKRCIIRHIDNLEYEHDLDIRNPMASYEKNPDFNPEVM